MGNTDQIPIGSDPLNQTDNQANSSFIQTENRTDETSASYPDRPYRTDPQLSSTRMPVGWEAKQNPLDDDSDLPNYDNYEPMNPFMQMVSNSYAPATPGSSTKRKFHDVASTSRDTDVALDSASLGTSVNDNDFTFRSGKRRARSLQAGLVPTGHPPSQAGPSGYQATSTSPLQVFRMRDGKEYERDDGYLRLTLSSDSKPSGLGDTRIEGNGSHPYGFELRSVIATEKDFEQDRGKNTFTLDKIPREFPLFHLRYNQKPPPNDYPRITSQNASEMSSSGSREGSGSYHDTPVKVHSGPGGRDDTAVEDEDVIMATALSRFDPRFIDLIPPQDAKFEQSLQDTAKWLRDGPLELKSFLSMHQKKYLTIEAQRLVGVDSPKTPAHEDKVSEACAKLLQAISVKFLSCLGLNPARISSWVACGTRELLPAKSTPSRAFGLEPANNPDQVMSLPVTQGSFESPPENATSRGTKRKREDAKQKTQRLTHDEVLVLLELKKDPKVESRVIAKKSQDRMVPRILRYALNTTANNAIAGRVTVNAVAATLIRFWFVDAFSFATTRVWDFAQADHAYEIVKMVAFLLGPIQDVLQTWKPPPDGFSTRMPAKRYRSLGKSRHTKPQPPDGRFAAASELELAAKAPAVIMDKDDSSSESMSEEERDTRMHWEWVNKEYKELWWQDKLLFGRRTTIWEGKIRSVDGFKAVEHNPLDPERNISQTEQAILDCTIKATFLPPGLVEHEHEMIAYLDPTIPLPNNSEFAKLDDKIKNEVYRNLPRSLGLVEFDESGPPTTRFLAANVPTDGRAPNLTHLKLAALVIQGPIGSTLEPRSDGLTLADVCEMYQGVIGQLWYGAERGVHFRDVSPGNILWRPMPGGRKVGFLIDYGNARFENERRDKSIAADSLEGLCEDDLRSGTRHFLCVAVLNAAVAVPDYRVVEAKLFDKTLKSTMREAMQADLQRLEQDLLTNRHRYIDDLESALYNLLSHASQCINVPSYAYDIVNNMLSNPEEKKRQWMAFLQNMAEAVSPGHFTTMISECAEIVRSARSALHEIMSRPDLTGRLIALEQQAYPKIWEVFSTGCRELRAQERAANLANASSV